MLTLNPIFDHGMILQANKAISVYGTGHGNITLSFLGETHSIKSEKENWCITLPAQNYGGPFTMRVTLNGEEKIIDDIWFGDVFLLAGQSNMQFMLMETDEPAENYKENTNVRCFTVTRPEEGETFRTEDGWVCCQKDTARLFPAIGYYVGNALNEHNGRKIGLISCNQGASVIQTWMPEEILADERFYVSDEDKFMDHFNFPFNGYGHLYKTMLSKLFPYSLCAVLWYQGEANSSVRESEIYLDLLSAFIGNVRHQLRDETLPFVVVQLADYLPWDGPGWRGIQAAQLKAQDAIPYVNTVVCRDVCQNDNLHPVNKRDLSARIVDVLLNR